MSDSKSGEVSFTKKATGSFDDVVANITKCLATQGFGVLHQIPFSGVLKKKINKDIEKTVVLAACNPHLVSAIYDEFKDVTVLIPCNVVVRQAGDDVEVCAMNPNIMGQVIGDNDKVKAIAQEATDKIKAAMEALE